MQDISEAIDLYLRDNYPTQVRGRSRFSEAREEDALEAAMKLVMPAMKDSVASTTKYVRSLDRLEGLADDMSAAAREMGDQSTERARGGRLANRIEGGEMGRLVGKFKDEVKRLNKYFADGRNEMYAAAQAVGVATRQSRVGGPPAKRIAAADMPSGNMVKEIERYAKNFQKEVRQVGELGSRAIKMGNMVLKNRSYNSFGELKDAVGEYMSAWSAFKNKQASVFYSLIGGISKRAVELANRQVLPSKRLRSGQFIEDMTRSMKHDEDLHEVYEACGCQGGSYSEDEGGQDFTEAVGQFLSEWNDRRNPAFKELMRIFHAHNAVAIPEHDERYDTRRLLVSDRKR